MRHSLAGVFIVLLFSVACAKIVVVPVTSEMKGEGMLYALPKTVTRVQLKVGKTVRTAAPYSRFAAIFAPDGTPACKEDEEAAEDRCTPPEEGKAPRNVAYSVEQGATFSTFGEPDPDNIYLVQFVGRGAVDQSLTMNWNEAGLLSSASSTVTNRTADVVVSGLKLVAGLGTRGAFGAPAESVGVERDKITECPFEESKNDPWILEVLQGPGVSGATAQVLVANYCEIAAEVRNDSFDKDRDKGLLERATGAYVARVVPLIDARIKVAGGNSTALEPIPLLNKIDSSIDEQLKALYLGNTASKVWDAWLDIRDLKVASPIQVFAVDKQKGVCFDEALLAPDGKPLPDGFVKLDAKSCNVPVNLTLDYHPVKEHQLFDTAGKVTPPPGDRSFRYRIPAQVRARLASGTGQTLGTGVFSVAQFGHVASLPANRHSKALSYDLTMLEATGGLKTFKLGTTGGLDAATVDALAGVGTSVLDARNAARKEAETAADEVTLLTREKTLLELKDKICDIQKKYGLTCTL